MSTDDTERALAVLKDDARDAGRIDIESRIIAAGFTILHEEDVESFVSGHCLVLQRARATGVLQTIIKTWREEHGGSGAFCGASDPAVAEQQISVLFPHLARSDTLERMAEPAALTSSNLRKAALDAGADAESVVSITSDKARSSSASQGTPGPRLTKSAMLRLGLTPPTTIRTASATSENSVLKRELSPSEKPRSLATPSNMPRVNRASALRTGDQEASPRAAPEKRATSSTSDRASHAENTPGYRREDLHIEVASTRSPSMQPRQTKASALRTGGAEASLGTPSKPRKALTTAERAAAERRNASPSIETAVSRAPPTIAPRDSRASALRTGTSRAAVTPTKARVALSTAERAAAERMKRQSTQVDVASMQTPLVAPKENRASALRTGKNDLTSSPRAAKVLQVVGGVQAKSPTQSSL